MIGQIVMKEGIAESVTNTEFIKHIGSCGVFW